MIGTSKSVWGFDPRTVPGCALWLDGNDPLGTGTLPANGATVSTWVDKSGNGANGTAVGTTPTFASGGGITFSAGAYSTSYSSSLTNESLFVVFRYTRTSGTLSLVGQTGDGARLLALGGGASTAQLQSSVYNVAVGALSLTTTVPINTIGLGELITTNSTMAIFYNGTSVGTPTAVTFTSGRTTVIGGASSGGSINASQYFGGIIHEVLGFTSVLTTSERQQIEGYLAHKWGLTGYYDSSIPLSIPGCQLWLDPANSSSLTLSGANVLTISNSSGTGGIATRLAGTSYATTTTISGNRILSFPGGQIVYRSPMVLTGAAYTIFTISSLLSASGYQRIINTDGPSDGRIFVGAINGVLATFSGNRGWNDIIVNTPNYSLTGAGLQIVTITVSGSSLIPYINGTAMNPKVGTTGATTVLDIGAFEDGVSQPWNGYIGDIIVYNTALTTTQRQTIEGYLMKKWGIGTNPMIPSTHPFSSIRPHLRTFQPSDVPGCQLWLDAADQSSLTLSGSNVTQWRDKSGNGYIAATPSGSVTQTTSINSIPVITIGNQSYLTIPSFVQNFPYYSAFFVMRSTNTIPSGSYNFMMWANVTNLINIGIQNNSGTFSVIAGKSGGYFMIGILGDNPQNQTFLISQVTTNSTATQYINRNGSPLSLDTNVSGTLGTLTASINVGGMPFSVAIGFDIGEILVYNTGLTTSQRQQVEGYLAHKWGLTLSLPVISPLSIPGCQLWFDAADSSTIAFSSGSNVSSWTNKGIVSTTATPTRGPSANQITYVTVDGYPGVYINNNGSVGYNASTYSQLTIQSNFQNTADYSVFAVVNLSNVPAGELQTIYGNARGTAGETRSPNFGAGWSIDFNNNISNRMISSSFIGTGRLQTALISSSSALTAYTNATAYASNTNAYTQPSTDAGPLPSIGGPGSFNDNRFATGYFHEILFYNTALTTSQRQQIEGYLARKWGISISATLPSLHPFKSFPPASLPFSPRNISGLALWLDGADPAGTGSTPSNGSTVTTWYDKSGTTNHGTSGSATFQTDSLGGYINFTGSQSYIITNPNIVVNQYFTIFIVEQIGNVPLSSEYTLMKGTVNDVNTNLHIVYRTSTPVIAFAFYFNDLNVNISSYGYGTGNTQPTRIWTFSFITNSRNIYLNGTSIGSDSSNTFLSSWTGARIGANSSSDYYIGKMREVMIYSGTITTSQRQQVEGYLAQKWRLTGSLPSTHPFKKLPA